MMRFLIILLTLFLCGCTAIMAGASFPSAPPDQDDIVAELQFDYSIDDAFIPFYYRWKCSYSRSWAASSGEWSIHESIDERVVVKKLTGSQYLYVRLPMEGANKSLI